MADTVSIAEMMKEGVYEETAERSGEGRRDAASTRCSIDVLLSNWQHLSTGTYGVIVDTKTCKISEGRYEEQEHFIVNGKLGQGGYGSVDLCTDTTTNLKFVRKTLHDETCLSRREVEVLKSLKHKNIVTFKGLILREQKAEIFLEFSGQDLKKLISDPDRYDQLVTDRNVARLAKQGLEALCFLDRHEILHLDVKPENICVMEVPDLELKLTDFGSCKAAQDPLQFDGWTPEYMSPEACRLYLMHKKNPHAPLSNLSLSGKTDVYAFGATIACMRYKQNPLTAVYMQNISLEQYVKKERIKIILRMHKNPGFMNALAQQIQTLTESERTLLAKLLAGDVNERCSAKEALKFVQEVMLPQCALQIRPARLLAPSAGVFKEAMSPPPMEEEELRKDDLEIDVRAGKQRGLIQTATPENTGADAISGVADQTGPSLDMQSPLTNAMASDLAVSISTKSPDVSKDSSAIPTMAAPAGNVGGTGYKEVPAGNTPATTLISMKGTNRAGNTVMSGKGVKRRKRVEILPKGVSTSGTDAMPQTPQLNTVVRTKLREHLSKRLKRHSHNTSHEE